MLSWLNPETYMKQFETTIKLQRQDQILKQIQKNKRIIGVFKGSINSNINDILIDEKYPLLIYLIQKNHFRVIQYLFDNFDKLDVNIKDEENKTPLMYDCSAVNPQLVEFLIQKGAKVDDQDQEGMTSIFHVIKSKADSDTKEKFINILVKNNASLIIKDKNGRTPFLYGCNKNLPTNLLKQLLISTDLNITDKDGNTPLLFAVFNNNKETVKFLLQKGAIQSIQRQNKLGWSPQKIAKDDKYSQIRKLFQEKLTESRISKEHVIEIKQPVISSSTGVKSTQIRSNESVQNGNPVQKEKLIQKPSISTFPLKIQSSKKKSQKLKQFLVNSNEIFEYPYATKMSILKLFTPQEKYRQEILALLENLLEEKTLDPEKKDKLYHLLLQLKANQSTERWVRYWNSFLLFWKTLGKGKTQSLNMDQNILSHAKNFIQSIQQFEKETSVKKKEQLLQKILTQYQNPKSKQLSQKLGWKSQLSIQEDLIKNALLFLNKKNVPNFEKDTKLHKFLLQNNLSTKEKIDRKIQILNLPKQDFKKQYKQKLTKHISQKKEIENLLKELRQATDSLKRSQILKKIYENPIFLKRHNFDRLLENIPVPFKTQVEPTEPYISIGPIERYLGSRQYSLPSRIKFNRSSEKNDDFTKIKGFPSQLISSFF